MKETAQKVEKVPLTEQLHSGETSSFARYRLKAAGDISLFSFAIYECFNLVFANLGGALGYVARKWIAKHLFRETGKGLILGRGLIVRHPKKISFGDNVAIDDYVLLDGGGSGEQGVHLGNGVIISRNCVVQGKTGHLVLGDRVDVGCNTVFSSVAGISIGDSTIIAGNCYLGGGRYYHGDREVAIMDQGGYSRGPLTIGEHSWVGAGATILDGVSVGRGVIVGAGSVVTKDVEDFSIIAGVPAKVIGSRQ